MIPRQDVLIGSLTHVGMERSDNQDYYGYFEPESDEDFELLGRLILVCDGMGGHAGGERASRLAVETIIREYAADRNPDRAQALRAAIEKANRAIWDEAQANPQLKGMGSTALALVLRQGLAIIGHVGDSRCYLIRNQQLHHMTKDHSLVQQMVDEGLIRPEDMENHPDKNVILRSMGVKPEVEVDISQGPYEVGDIYVLSSDGLTGLVSDEEIRQVCLHLQNNPMEACRQLIDRANQYGGYDNITVQVVRVLALRPGDPIQLDTGQGYSAEDVRRSIEEARRAMIGKTMPSQDEMAGRSPDLGGGQQKNITATISAEEVEAAKREALRQKQEAEAAKAAAAAAASAAAGRRGGGGAGTWVLAGVALVAVVLLLAGIVLSKQTSKAYARMLEARAEAQRVANPDGEALKAALKQAREAEEAYQTLLGTFTAKRKLERAAEELERIAKRAAGGGSAAASRVSADAYAQLWEQVQALRNRAEQAEARRYAPQHWTAAERHADAAAARAQQGDLDGASRDAEQARVEYALAHMSAVEQRARQRIAELQQEIRRAREAAERARAPEHLPELLAPAERSAREAERLAATDPAAAMWRLEFASLLYGQAAALAPTVEKKN
ncbi:MAG: hypothetical protein KatS3mg102_2068 [Planctomycetota bacterium]|nr:MAG: hypothetical protein KatS3mg102_2068 [Planctomycetota bacterium]